MVVDGSHGSRGSVRAKRMASDGERMRKGKGDGEYNHPEVVPPVSTPRIKAECK